LDSCYSPAYRRVKDVLEVLTYLRVHLQSHLRCENAVRLSEVYSAAIGLLPEVASFGLNPSARLSVLAGAGPLTTWGATHAISIGRLDVALEMLEAGRSLFWTQHLQLRTSFMELPTVIGDRLTRISYALARPLPDGLQGVRKDGELSRRRQLGDEFRSVLDEARTIPGFESLLLNTSFTSVAQAAICRPIVVIVAHEVSGHAIIIEGEAQCCLVELPNTSAKALQELSNQLEKHSKRTRSSRGIRRVKVEPSLSADIYRELWTSVMLPIIEALQWPVSRLILVMGSISDVSFRSPRDESVGD
jgi:hypothetical protein